MWSQGYGTDQGWYAPSGVSGDALQTTAFLARTSALGTTRTALYKTLINKLVANGYFDLLDGLWILSAKDLTTMCLNLCGTNYTLVPHGTFTLTPDVGWAGDGSTGFLDTTFDPATAVAPKFTLESATLGIINRANPGGIGTGIGSTNGSQSSFIFFQGASDRTAGDLNAGNFATLRPVGTNLGALTLSRNSGFIQSFVNGDPTVVGSSNEPAVVIPNFSMFIGARNNSGTPDSPITDQFAAAYIGAGVTPFQAAGINILINEFLIGLGVNVFPDTKVVNWIADGDSITAGAGGLPAYPCVALASMPGGTASTPGTNTPASSIITGVGYVALNDIGVVGQQLSVMVANFSTVVAPLVVLGADNILTVMAGTNDAANGATSAQIYASLKSYVALARAAGFQRIGIGTMTARNDDGGALWTSTIAPTNALTRANYNGDLGADFLIDFGADPRFSSPTAANDLTYYTSDKLHPNVTGEAAMGAIAEPVVLAAMS